MANVFTAIKGVKFIPFLFKYWYIWLTLIFILPTIVHSAQDSHEQGDYSIFLKEVGGMFASADNQLYEKLQEFSFEKEIPKTNSEKINYYSSLFWKIGSIAFIPIWMMLFMFVCLYRGILFLSGNDSAKLGAAIITSLIVIILQVVVGKIPFKGLILMLKSLWVLI